MTKLVLKPDDALEGPQDWMFEVMEEGDPQGWSEENLRRIETEEAIKNYEEGAW
jgi:hypothetical protein